MGEADTVSVIFALLSFGNIAVLISATYKLASAISRLETKMEGFGDLPARVSSLEVQVARNRSDLDNLRTYVRSV